MMTAEMKVETMALMKAEMTVPMKVGVKVLMKV